MINWWRCIRRFTEEIHENQSPILK
ncbi:hypothetical protein Gohar_009091 [Gossypium harknessii]|uniref:Uncharacterized protein n=1 Tax=Gossypium harknessii TaxID=34285 RepID=A0A7J9GN25_9ROSI|nr:hypothetical protein [Gossypium harknessii]